MIMVCRNCVKRFSIIQAPLRSDTATTIKKLLMHSLNKKKKNIEDLVTNDSAYLIIVLLVLLTSAEK